MKKFFGFFCLTILALSFSVNTQAQRGGGSNYNFSLEFEDCWDGADFVPISQCYTLGDDCGSYQYNFCSGTQQ